MTKVILYLIAQITRICITIFFAVITYVPMYTLAFNERGYSSVGGEIVPVILITIAVWKLAGYLIHEWYKGLLAETKLLNISAESSEVHQDDTNKGVK